MEKSSRRKDKTTLPANQAPTDNESSSVPNDRVEVLPIAFPNGVDPPRKPRYWVPGYHAPVLYPGEEASTPFLPPRSQNQTSVPHSKKEDLPPIPEREKPPISNIVPNGYYTLVPDSAAESIVASPEVKETPFLIPKSRMIVKPSRIPLPKKQVMPTLLEIEEKSALTTVPKAKQAISPPDVEETPILRLIPPPGGYYFLVSHPAEEATAPLTKGGNTPILNSVSQTNVYPYQGLGTAAERLGLSPTRNRAQALFSGSRIVQGSASVQRSRVVSESPYMNLKETRVSEMEPKPPPLPPRPADTVQKVVFHFGSTNINRIGTVFEKEMEDLEPRHTALILQQFPIQQIDKKDFKVRSEVCHAVKVVFHSLYKRGFNFFEMIPLLENNNMYLDTEALRGLTKYYPDEYEQAVGRSTQMDAKMHMFCMAIDGRSKYVLDLLKMFVFIHDVTVQVNKMDALCHDAHLAMKNMKGPIIASVMQVALKVANTINDGSQQLKVESFSLEQLPDLLAVNSHANEKNEYCVADFVVKILEFSEEEITEITEIRERIKRFPEMELHLFRFPKQCNIIQNMKTEENVLRYEKVQSFYNTILDSEKDRCVNLKFFYSGLPKLEESVKTAICADISKPLSEAAQILVNSLDMVLSAMKAKKVRDYPSMRRKMKWSADEGLMFIDREIPTADKKSSKPITINIQPVVQKPASRNTVASRHKKDSDKPTDSMIGIANKPDESNVENPAVSTNGSVSHQLPNPSQPEFRESAPRKTVASRHMKNSDKPAGSRLGNANRAHMSNASNEPHGWSVENTGGITNGSDTPQLPNRLPARPTRIHGMFQAIRRSGPTRVMEISKPWTD